MQREEAPLNLINGSENKVDVASFRKEVISGGRSFYTQLFRAEVHG